MQKEPRGADLLATLIDLLAEQEGVKITYEIKDAAALEGVMRELIHSNN